MKRRIARHSPVQHRLQFPARARRARDGAKPHVPHARRPAHSRHHPVHVTARLRAGLPRLRRPAELEVVLRAFSGGRDRFGFRLVHFSIQNDHLHLIAEAEDARSLSRGMKGLLVRVARALNRLWRRRGAVFADRYHAHALRTPREVRNALVYVLHNAKKHVGAYAGVDPGSSGHYFDGWADISPTGALAARAPVMAAGSWLLRVGWRRHGRIRVGEVPRSAGP